MIAGFRAPLGALVAGGMGRSLLGQNELSGGGHLKTVLLATMQDHHHASAAQKLLAGDCRDLAGLRTSRGRFGRSLLDGIVHNPPLTRPAAAVNDNANHSQQVSSSVTRLE